MKVGGNLNFKIIIQYKFKINMRVGVILKYRQDSHLNDRVIIIEGIVI